MKKRTLLTPIDLSDASRVGKRLYEKQILPVGTISYKGRTLNFDRPYLTDLANSFKQKAFDQVPLVFADPENRHNLDPKRFGGEIRDFVVKNDGLYAKIAVTKDTAKVLNDNPRLGVSARIMEGLEKSDGRRFDRAIQHVLLTMDPRVTGMKPWQTIDLSGYDGAAHRVVDLTALTFERETAMPKIRKGGSSTDVKARKAKTAEQPDANGILDLSSLSDEELDILLSATAVEDPPKSKSKKRRAADATESVEDDVEIDDEDDEDEDVEDLDPDDFEDDDEDEDDDTDDEDSDEEEDGEQSVGSLLQAEKERRAAKSKGKKGRKDLSSRRAARRQIDLAGGAVDSTIREDFSQMQIDLAEERWTSKRKEYLRAGVPPFLLDLAAPVLSSPEAVVVDLSNADEPVNASQIIEQMLDGAKGMIDLRPEIGHRIDLSADEESGDKDKALLEQWDQEYGVR